MTSHFDNHSYALLEAQQEVDEVKEVMRENIDKVLLRGERLEDLEDSAEDVLLSAERFHRSARRIERKFCLQAYKWKIILGLVILVILGLIGYGIFSAVDSGSSGGPAVETTTTTTTVAPATTQ